MNTTSKIEEPDDDPFRIRRKFLDLWEQTRNAPDYKREEWLEFDDLLTALIQKWNEVPPRSAFDKIKSTFTSIDFSRVRDGLKRGVNKFAEQSKKIAD